MRRYYITTRRLWRAHVNLFHPQLGSHYVDLANGMVLVSTDFESTSAEEKWHLHPAVARLWNNSLERTNKLSDLLLPVNVHKQFTQSHLTALASIGVTGAHTVADVHKIALALHPLCRLNVEY